MRWIDKLFHKGNLGQQVFIKSPKAFDNLVFTGFEEVKPQHGSTYGNADAQARRKVFNYLSKRERAIQLEGFTPVGITAREAINNDFEYSKEYFCYLPVIKDETQSLSETKTNAKKGKKNELEP